jgi:hypothetical protein
VETGAVATAIVVMQLRFPGFPMVRSVGPLMYGLGMCAIVGCATGGNGRSVDLNDRASPTQIATRRPTVDNFAGNQSLSNDGSLAGAQSNPAPLDSADPDDQWMPSHSAEQLAAISGRRGSRSRNINAMMLQPGHEFDQSRMLNPPGSIQQANATSSAGATADLTE